MAKRPAEEPLEDSVATADSPASKKARVAIIAEDIPPPPPPPPDEPTYANGQYTTNDNPDIIHADRKQHAELEEANASSDEEEDDDNDEDIPTSRLKEAAEGYQDLYLDSIDRSVLDFDFLRQCSITLSNQNVYACLVCGKYFSGRGLKTPAYFHALEVGHHVYINMETKKVYVLPEGYEVKSKSLDDIKVVVDPEFTPTEVKALDKNNREPSRDLQGRKYHPGFIGLNNVKANDYLNVVAQALGHVTPLRNFLLLEKGLSTRRSGPQTQTELINQFGILVRKLWNPKAFKSHVSPHELMQEIALRSNKKYLLTTQADPVEFLSWFLNHLHLSLGGSKTKPQTSLIQKIFQGNLRIESQTITARADAGDRLRFEPEGVIKSQTTPFTILTLDLPPAPLFQSSTADPDGKNNNIIPQIPLTTILQKYNGLQAAEKLNTRLRYRLLHPLPPYLILHVKRFESNKFLQAQRNPTIVTFNPRALDMSPFVEPNPEWHGVGEALTYDLVANVTYEGVKVRDDSVEGEAERKVWKVIVREGGGGGVGGGKGDGDGGEGGKGVWWEMQDLFVKRVEGDLLASKESYFMIWERRRKSGGGGSKGIGKSS